MEPLRKPNVEDIPSQDQAWALVLGDLTYDMIHHSSESDLPRLAAASASSSDAFIRTTSHAAVGGSGLLFAEALAASPTSVLPRLLGAVGDDPQGQAILDGLTAKGIDCFGIARLADRPTCTIALVYFEAGSRLTFAPHESANDYLTLSWVEQNWSPDGHRTPTLVWLSGYAVRARDVPRFEAVKRAVALAHEHNVPVVADLVPHDFKQEVGSLEWLTEQFGPFAATVSELRTLRDLGAGEEASLATASTWLANEQQGLSIVQQQQDDATYAQALSDGRDVYFDEQRFQPHTLRGLGDRLAVRALVQAGVLGSI